MVRNKALLAAVFWVCSGSVHAIEILNRPYGPGRDAASVLPLQTAAPAQAAAPVPPMPSIPSVAPVHPVQVQVTPVLTSEPLKQSWAMDVKDVNYYGVFQRWGRDAGYQVRWDAEKHFVIEAVNTFSGSFEDAVTAVLDNPAVAYSKYPLEVCFYPNVPPLARITRKGAQEKECQ